MGRAWGYRVEGFGFRDRRNIWGLQRDHGNVLVKDPLEFRA